MSTEVLRILPESPSPEILQHAAEVLREGGLVALPTETVYGIAARADRPEVVTRLLAVRESPQDKNLTIHLGDVDALVHHVRSMSPFAMRLAQRFWPGPLTIVFVDPMGPGTPAVGIRVPAHPVASQVLARAGVPVVLPSANRSGQPPAVQSDVVRAEFDGKVDLILDGGPCRIGKSSTVVRASATGWDVLREGAIPTRLLADLDYRTYLFVCTGNTCRSPMAAALFRNRLAERLNVREDALPEKGIHVESAGTDAGHGGSCAPNAAEVVAQLGGNLAHHSTRPVTPAFVEECDHIYVMTQRHLSTLLQWTPDAAARARLLDPAGTDIDDPIGGDRDAYRRVADQMLAMFPPLLDQAVREAAAYSSRR